MEQSKVKSYRSIVSSTAIFGGAQVMNMLVNLIRGKIVSSILGPAGMGISNLYHTTADTIQQFSMMGVNVSAVRNISQDYDSQSKACLSATVSIVRKLMLFSALTGLIATIACAPWLTHFLFDDSRYLPFMMMLCIAVLFNILGCGEYTLLQGMRRYKHIALCSTVPPLCGLLVGVPIYMLLGADGIVLAMIAMAVIYYAAIRYLSSRVMRHLPQAPRIPFRQVWIQGGEIIKFGIIMTIATLLGTATTFGISAFIQRTGSEVDLGFYSSANAITMQYIGMVFSAMAASYYPQLASCIKKSMKQARQLVNQQTEIVLLVITPLSTLIVLTAPILIVVLLKSSFLPMVQLVRFMGITAFFRALCFPMDYLSLSKGDKQFFFWVEGVWTNVKTFTLLALFYYRFGLDGLGYAVLLSSVIDVCASTLLNYWRYRYRFSRQTLILLIKMFIPAAICFACSFISDTTVCYTLMAITSVFTIGYSYRQLDKRIDLSDLLRKKFCNTAANDKSCN